MIPMQNFEVEYEISILVAGYLRGDLTDEQTKKLAEWQEASTDHIGWFNDFCQKGKIDQQLKIYEAANKALVWNKIQDKILADAHVPAGMALWQKIAIAASILLCLSIGLLFYLGKYANSSLEQQAARSGITTGGNKAYLTLANGKQVLLSGTKTGVVIDAAKLTYNDGSEIQAGSGTGDPSSDTKGMMISTPQGGTYQVVLPDGTRVWLNAGSGLNFPVKFTGTTRSVQLSGEAYFQVVKDKKHPFIVKTNKQEIMVLGTHFNVAAYQDEMANTTTLLEGSVHISHLLSKSGSNIDLNGKILKPGEQSVLTDQSLQVNQVDTEEAVAWKNGYFRFNKENIVTVMRKLSRWYNIAVVYEGPVPEDEFSGTASRNKSIGQVLNMLQYSKSVQFKIEGRRVTVKR